MAQEKGFIHESRPASSSLIGSITLASISVSLHVNKAVDVTSDGVIFLFADNIKIVCTFHPDAVGPTVAKKQPGKPREIR